MTGHTSWNEIRHKDLKGVQVVIYSLHNGLSRNIVSEVTKATEEIVKKYDDLAYTVVEE